LTFFCFIHPNFCFQRDAVPTEEVRLAVISRRLAAVDDNDVEKLALEKELEKLINVSFI